MKFHFSFHKCLTKYTSLTLNRALNNMGLRRSGYKHFNSLKREFIEGAPRLDMASLNNHFLTVDELESISGEKNTYSLFIRDPRDLIVSGYYYHKKGREAWTRIAHPEPEDYRVVNGCVPMAIKESGLSFSDHLEQCEFEEGLLLELEFRRNHFASLSNWLAYDSDDFLFVDYFEVMRGEEAAFSRLARHHGLNCIQMKAIVFFARKYKAANSTKNAHIRNPQPGQWKEVLTKECLDALEREFPNLIDRYEKISSAA